MVNARSWRLRYGLLGAGFAAALVAAALGGLAGPGAAAPRLKVVTVTEKEFSLTPSTRRLAAGKVTLVAVNRGKLAHALSIAGPGVKARSAVLAPGKSARLTVTLRNGSYTMWCPVGNHAALGMKLALRVGGSAATSASPTTSPVPAAGSTGGSSTSPSSGGGGGWG